MQEFEGGGFPTGAFQHIPDPTAIDNDANGDPEIQAFYAPHWGNVDPFGHTATGSLPNPITGPLGNLTNIAQYFEDFEQVLVIGTCLLACGFFRLCLLHSFADFCLVLSCQVRKKGTRLQAT